MTGPELLARAMQDRDSGAVRRWHVTRTNRVQTVAEHTWGCCMLLMLVAPDCRPEVYKAMLTHDHAERATGDVPATAKAMWPGLRHELIQAEKDWHRQHGLQFELSIDEQTLIDFCDYFELALWSYEELCMGNLYAREPLYGITSALRGMRHNGLKNASPIAAELLDTWLCRLDAADPTSFFTLQPR